jgi:hypothetical protein
MSRPPHPPRLYNSSHENDRVGTYASVPNTKLVFLRSVRRLLVTASVVPSSPILVTLMKEAQISSKTSVLTGATRPNIPEDAILQSWSLIPEKEYGFSFVHSVHTGSGAHPAPYQKVRGGRREAAHNSRAIPSFVVIISTRLAQSPSLRPGLCSGHIETSLSNPYDINATTELAKRRT